MDRFIGIDGGGSITTALSADRDGKSLAAANSSPANIHALSTKALSQLIRNILDQLHAGSAADVHIVAGFAGAGHAAGRASVLNVFQNLGYENRCRVVTDMEIALKGALPEGPGIVLNSGTGSFAYGRSANGRTGRCGGWGYLLGDDGSGYALGLEAIRRSLKSCDKALPETVVSDRIRNKLELGEITDIVPGVYSGNISPSVIASCAQIVLDAASEGDPVSKEIIEEASADLALLAISLARKLKMDRPVKLCLTGSVLQKSAVMLPFLKDILNDSFRFVNPEYPPVAGAVMMAVEYSGLNISDTIRSNLKKIYV
ncbi:N-acetylglucosamine kinase [candidate division KSB1 bacterium]